MEFLITFLEGIISFISPCMLPLLPVFISYFAGGTDKKGKMVFRALAFVAGFTLVFSLMGLFAGSLGSFVSKHERLVDIIAGSIMIIFGLSYLDVIKIDVFKESHHQHVHGTSNLSAFVFGMVYSISHSPCVGAFLGSALTLAATSSTAFKGLLLLVAYSLGLGVPFILSALMIDKLNSVFTFIKKHYEIINKVCGIFLIIVGLLMITGLHELVHSLF